ncbi:MAG: TCR/Tet family MFS transporter [Candidatus Eremiobacteraeota bacterium]|nr:TCR/Tet family MFS transporter [Candidatus Eremiobacteraeota bacterium]MBV9056747.1 TCR/Tet family MFS transporter [Candidatus Eremiobacteraeota bacterium]MBV9700260.1 TCR/Tet family MFS transporter [Candidatus Eremiobacteraeota bacterium]
MLRAERRRAATVFIFITVLIDMLTFGMIGPVLPKLIASFVGNNYAHAAQVIGVFATVWALMQFFCSPLLGMLSDRVGRRPVILISNGVTAIDYAIMALAPNLWWLFAGRVLSGIATANIATASAYIADVTEPAKRAAAFGMIGSAFGLGFVLGPAIGGIVGNVDPRLTFWVAAGFALLNTLYGFLVLPESLPLERRTRTLEWKRANPLGSLKLLRSHPELWGLTWVNFITYTAHEVFPNVWVIFCIAAYGWSTGSVGLTLALVGIVAAINQATMVGPVVKRLGERRVLLASLVIAVVGLALLGTNSGIVFLIGAVVVALPMYQASSQALMTRRVGAAEQGELQGALGSIRGISMLIGPSIFTLTFAQFAGPWRSAGLIGAPWFLAALFYVASLVVAWRVTSRSDDVVLPLPEPAPPIYAET